MSIHFSIGKYGFSFMFWEYDICQNVQVVISLTILWGLKVLPRKSWRITWGDDGSSGRLEVRTNHGGKWGGFALRGPIERF
jgi:hypothetical protein